MLFNNLRDRFFQLSLLTFVMGFGVSHPANALDFNLTWTGTDAFGAGTSSLTGTFSGVDLDSDGVLEGGNLSGGNEVTAFDITFSNTNEGTLATYNLSQLLSFNPSFNFNYDIASGNVLQSGNANSSTGFAIGDGDLGYLLDTTAGSGISFTDFNNFTANDQFGTLSATAVPFEFSPMLSLGILGAAFAIRKRYRQEQVKTKAMSQIE
ncbi:hypothetical protein WJM97_17255 [Okeanomitos corallinicola TIOX110]|uniref:PEP-CTERM protein-sorting domain-containing protein n=1 Tax=Okeanomitos corallinicola TIOX110 TaxID=3133117 RepID=A0ABZ2UPR2_9CYAN